MCKYLDNLMAHLGRLITSPNVNVREMAVSAIGSVVIGSQHHFAKYAPSPLCTRTPADGVSRAVARVHRLRFFEATMGVMLSFMQLRDDESMALRAR